jgi:hypothetical protein
MIVDTLQLCSLIEEIQYDESWIEQLEELLINDGSTCHKNVTAFSEQKEQRSSATRVFLLSPARLLQNTTNS